MAATGDVEELDPVTAEISADLHHDPVAAEIAGDLPLPSPPSPIVHSGIGARTFTPSAPADAEPQGFGAGLAAAGAAVNRLPRSAATPAVANLSRTSPRPTLGTDFTPLSTSALSTSPLSVSRTPLNPDGVGDALASPQAASGFPNLPRVDPQKVFKTAGSSVTGAARPAPPDPLNETARISAKIDQDYRQTREAIDRNDPNYRYGERGTAGAASRNVQAATSNAQEQEKSVVNTELRNTLRDQRVETEQNPDTGLVQPVRDSQGQIKFKAGRDEEVALDRQLHSAARDALGQDVYKSALNLRQLQTTAITKQDELKKLGEESAALSAKTKETEGGIFGIGRSPSAAATAARARLAEINPRIEELQQAGYGNVTSKGAFDDPAEVADAKKAHKTLTEDKSTWSQLSITDAGQLDDALNERKASIIAAGGDPENDRVIQAIEARKNELGIQSKPEDEHEQVLRNDPTFGPILKRRDDLDAQANPLQNVTDKLLSRLETMLGLGGNMTATGGDPDARLGLLRAYTDHVTDPAQKGRVQTLLKALEPRLAELRQTRTQRDLFGAQVEGELRAREEPELSKLAKRVIGGDAEAVKKINLNPVYKVFMNDLLARAQSGELTQSQVLARTKLFLLNGTTIESVKNRPQSRTEARTAAALGESLPAGPEGGQQQPVEADRKADIARVEARTAAAVGEPPPSSPPSGTLPTEPGQQPQSGPVTPTDFETNVSPEAKSPHGEISASPTIGGELKRGNILTAAGMAWEDVRRQLTPFLGPTKSEEIEQAIPSGTNPDGTTRFEYRPAGDAIQKKGLIPAVSEFVMRGGSPFGVADASLGTTPESRRQQPAAGDSKLAATGKAITNTIQGLVETFSNPAMLMIPGNRAVAGAFSVDMLSGVKGALEKVRNGRTQQEQIEGGLEATIGLVLGGLSGKHALTKKAITPETIAEHIDKVPAPALKLAIENQDFQENGNSTVVAAVNGESQRRLTAAHAEIEGLQPTERMAPEQVAPTQDALRAMVKISQGAPMNALTATEKRAVLLKHEDGLPRVEMVNGKPVILDAALARVKAIAPETAKILPSDETSQRQAILSPQEGAEQPAKQIAQPGGQPSPVAKRAVLLSKVLQRNGVDPDTAAAFANKFVADRGAAEPAYDQRDAVKEAFTGAGGKLTETGERDPAADQANRAVREKIQRVGPEAGAYETGSGKKETIATAELGGATVVGETRGVRPIGENRESASPGQSAQTPEQAATKPELAARTHVDDSIDAAFEQRKGEFTRAGIHQITETTEPIGATGFREKPDGSRELLVNREIAREWFDKFSPEKARELIGKGFEEEAKHAIERKVARDNGTDTAALYRDWAKHNPDQEKILANAYGKGWASYSDTGKSAELARMILQTRASGRTTEQLHLGPERAAAVDRALKQFKEPVRLTGRLRQHFTRVLEYLRGIKNPSKAILDHIREVERFAGEPQTTSTLAMARPDSANSARDREQARIDGAKLPMQRFKDAEPLAERVASGYRNIAGVDVKDVEQHARIALTRASKAFDSSREVPFEAFARVAINNELRGLYRKQSRIAEQTILDEPLSAETSETRASQLPDEAGRSPADEAAYNEGVKVLHEAIDALPAKMRTVMTRLAAGDDPGAIARDLDIAKQGVSNLKIAALRRLRGKLGEQGITGIDDDGILRMAKPNPSDISIPTGETPEEKRGFKRAAIRLVPGLNVAKDIKTGIQSLLLPTAQTSEHVAAAVDLGRPLGEMHHRQEVSAYELKPDWKAFEKLGVHREDVPLTENAGIKFMSDMSQGRLMTETTLQSVADRIDAMFIERLDHLEKAGAPLESVRENYFPGMWTRESREAFNQAMGEFREAGKLADNFDVNAAPAELKSAIKARADELLENGQGSTKDMISFFVRTPMKGKESFRKRKVFDDIMTGVEFGLRPISNNPADLVMGKLAEMDKSIMANQAFRAWEKKGQLVAFDNSGRPMREDLRRGFNRDDWQRINDKYGTIWHRNEETGMLEKVGERWATRPVADIVNNYLSSSLYNNRYFGKLYAGWMATANALNQTQLGVGSAFHAGFTTAEAQISAGANLMKDIYGVMRGNRSFADLARTIGDYPTAFFKTAMTGDKVLNAWRNPDGVIDSRIAQIVRASELAGAGYKLERGLKTDQSTKLVSDWVSGHKIRGAMRSPIAFTELLAKPIMEYLVPRQKAGVFSHLAWRIIEQNPGRAIEDLAPEFRDAWNRVDARLGQVRYDRLFINNTAKNVVQALVRAPGWSGGTIAELGGAFKDAGAFLKEWQQTGSLPKDVPDRVAYSLSLLVTTAALNGALTYLFTGSKPEGQDYMAFRTGREDEAGNPERFTLPTYMKDVWAYAKNPGETLLHKSHPLLSLFGDLIENKDYYGVEVRDRDASIVEQALQSGVHVVKSFTPFWIRGAQRASQRGAGVGQLAMPMIGVMPAPKSMTVTPAQELAYELQKRKFEGLTKTRSEGETSRLLSELTKAARAGDTQPVRQAILEGKITRAAGQRVISRARLTPFQATVHGIALSDALRVFEKANSSEKDELRTILQNKNDEAHKRGDIATDDYVANKMALAGPTKPQTTRPVLHSKPVMPRPQFNRTEGQKKKVSAVNLIKEWKRAA